MANTSTFSSSSSSFQPKWDVFLSFYGKDTRRNFIANLYFALDQAGILTFRDDPALEKGEEISSGLCSAIASSKKFVVVISENYARSSWCLDELVEILGCKKTENQIIPVFYYVDPSDLRHQKGSFGEALDYHKRRYSCDMIDKWKNALAAIAQLSGYHLKKDANENESDTIQDIVENVAPQVSTNVLHIDEYLCGMNSAVEEIHQKLRMKSNDVRALGICGMGGIGKTTTAKVFYNKYSSNFDISCFIENIKQNSQGSSLLPLLKQILTELLRRKDYMVRNVESGIRQLKQILRFKKALIVLDDLDQSSYLELLLRICNLFSGGSRIIITTRDANLLNLLKMDVSEVDIYMVNKLSQSDSLELFSYHAFKKQVPPDNFRELSVMFVTYAGGLPLALKVLGSSLRGRSHVSFWKAKLEKVREIPDNEIQKILQMSYDELEDETEKAIFLDIVFFFVAKDRDESVNIFKSCNFFPDAGIPILVERCLLTIDEENKFQMHNLIQEMGRNVIREESIHGMCRRLHLCQGNACESLQNLEGTEKIEGLILDLSVWSKRDFSAKIFKRLPNLRLLEIINAHDIEGNFENSFYELRCIRWHHCSWTRLPSSFRPEKLVSLDMPFSKLKTLWKGTMPLQNLKTINVSYSKKLETTSDFSNLNLVEKLSLRGCKRLLEVHPSIGQLTNLSHLDLSECDNLKELPEPFGRLAKLDHLDLRGCVSLKRLPKPIKHLTYLGYLDLGHCRNLKRLPEQLGDMRGLRILDVSFTAIEQLPDSITCLKELVKLELHNCKKLKKLPEHFGNIEGLRTFDASCSAIEQLPVSFASLINLVDLNLIFCKKLTSLPNNIWMLKLLKVLDLGYCSKLEQLPEQLGKMQSLEVLSAAGTAIEKLPDSIGQLSNLTVLELSRCEKLIYLPGSIWNLASLAQLVIENVNLPDAVNYMNLECLHLKCNVRLSLPKILSFSCLKELSLTDEGQSFSSIEPVSLTTLSNLESLTLQNCTGLGSSFPELPLNLADLRLYNHATLEQLPDLSHLKQLKKLIIRTCIHLQSLLPLPVHLQSLIVFECTSLHDLPDLSMLKDLKDLSFDGCSNLKSVCLKESSLQVGGDELSSFKADLPNRGIPEWFGYKSSGCTLSLDIPPTLGENFLGVALWVVYKYNATEPSYSYIKAIVRNKTEGKTENYKLDVPTDSVGVQSRVQCIRREDISLKCGDRMKVSFERLLFSNDEGAEVPNGEVNVEMCGAHMIMKTFFSRNKDEIPKNWVSESSTRYPFL